MGNKIVSESILQEVLTQFKTKVEEGNGIISNGDGTKSLRNDGTYKNNTYNELLDKPSINGTELTGNVSLDTLGVQPKGSYATSEELTAVDLKVSSTQTTVVQKVLTDLKADVPVTIDNLAGIDLSKCVVQLYEFIAGGTDKVQTLKVFNNSNASNFYYDPTVVEFTDSNASLRDSYIYETTLNSDGFYETPTITLNNIINIGLA